MRNQATSTDLAAFRNWSAAVDDDLLQRAEQEAQSGAKIVFWAEGNATVLKEGETAFLAGRTGGQIPRLPRYGAGDLQSQQR